jgi:hypothetical protein
VVGTCVQEFGTLASWGCDLVNILTGNLDRAGGVMFTTPAAPIDAALARRDPRIVDMLLRVGPYGDGFGRREGGLTLKKLREAPPTMTGDLPRLRARLAQGAPDLVLIGRRDMRRSNSFMHR